MKNFIFAMCGFLMMSLVSLGVQASSFSEPILPKSDVVMVDVGLPMIQNEVVKIVPMDYLVETTLYKLHHDAKYLTGCEVCELAAYGGQGVRVADCNPSVKKAVGLFDSLRRTRSGCACVLFILPYFPALRRCFFCGGGGDGAFLPGRLFPRGGRRLPPLRRWPHRSAG